MAAPRKPSFSETLKAGWRPPAIRMAGRGPQAKAAARGSTTVAKAGKVGAGQASPNGAPALSGAVSDPQLLKQREKLAHQFAELQWDLGGMTYEMAARDHYRLDVLNKQAAKLQKVDAELGQVERVLKMEGAGAAGTCPSCDALQARGAVYCWQCGKELKPESKPSAKPAGTGTAAKATRTAKSAAGKAKSAAGKARPGSRSKSE